MEIIYKLNIEFRELSILRLKLLKDIPSTQGVVPIDEFKKLFRCIVTNSTEEFERKFVSTIKNNKDTVSYQKLCDIITKFQYNLHYAK